MAYRATMGQLNLRLGWEVALGLGWEVALGVRWELDRGGGGIIPSVGVVL
jgi:hypothetical protein